MGGRKSTPIFGEATKHFRDAGIPARALLPIAPVDARLAPIGNLKEDSLGKSPGRYNARAENWRGLGGDYTSKGVPPEEAAAMHGWPTPNVGILGLYAPGIDSDAESEDARRFVERVLVAVFGDDAAVAERLRGDVPRRLYAFKCRDPNDPEARVRTRHISYRLKGETEHDRVHKLDVIGNGNQYLIAGTHPSGADYKWHPDFDLAELHGSRALMRIEDADVRRFLDEFRDRLERDGGVILSSRGGAAPGSEHDYSAEEPIFAVKDIFDGLDRLPNTEDNFPDRDDFVSVLSAIRAALGSEAEFEREAVAAWACEDPVWCSGEYFDKVWESLDRGVRVQRTALDGLFRRNGIFVSARSEFPDDAKEVTKPIKERKAEQRAEEADLLDIVQSKFVFGHVNTRADQSTLRMRRAFDPFREWNALDWWQFKSVEPETGLIADLHDCARYGAKPEDFWTFIRDFAAKHPDAFYHDETRDPRFSCGDIVVEDMPHGGKSRSVNMRFLSPVILHARFPAKDTKQAREDCATVLEFVRRMFGEMAEYELDTLAYMAQSSARPGHMLFLVGEPGMGKSIYTHMLVSMFDGLGKDQGGQIDGTKMTNEAARRFALARVEGCRIISVKELPEGSTASNMAAVTSSLKQIVDPGPDGDYFQVEAKGKDSRSVRNFARVVATSNYQNSIQVEEQDRRIFFVRCGIDAENKPEPEYYADLTDVTTNTERLAAFYRYLLTRDVTNYAPAAPPPVSREKSEAMVAGISDPFTRHMRGALETLRLSRRWIFDGREFGEIMSAMAENEYRNTEQAVDDRRQYDLGASPASTKKLARYVERIATLKSNGTRLPTIYALRTARPQIKAITSADRNTILDALDLDREANPLVREHVWSVFDGPPRVKAKG